MAHLHRLVQIGSTMDRLHQLAAEGAPAGTAIVAEEQTGGRGSRGRRWLSPRGGLWLSVLLRPIQPAGVELLSLRTGLAVAEAVETVAPVGPIGLKWPNDLMAGGRKLGGILCEARWVGPAPGWVAVGLGLNVANPIPAALRSIATSLGELAPGIELEPVLAVVLERLRRPPPPDDRLSPDELERLRARDWLRGRSLLAPVPGQADGIAADGSLRVRRPDGSLEAVRAGSVELAPSPSPR